MTRIQEHIKELQKIYHDFKREYDTDPKATEITKASLKRIRGDIEKLQRLQDKINDINNQGDTIRNRLQSDDIIPPWI